MRINKFCFVTFLLLTAFTSKSQETGIFQRIIQLDNTNRILEYAVPYNYSESVEYALLIALHGCSGNTNAAAYFRDDFSFLIDSLDIIVVCPNAIGSGVMDTAIIKACIDSTMTEYNVDTTNIFITGFSCNGHIAMKKSTNQLYNWKGIIPYNPGFNIAYLETGVLDYTHQIQTCICIGSIDPSFELINRYKDSLAYHGTPYYYNEMPGIGHTTDFVEFPSEIMECFHWFNGTILSTPLNLIDNKEIEVIISQNVMWITNINKNNLLLDIYDTFGRSILSEKLYDKFNEINLTTLKKGIYVYQLKSMTKDNYIANSFVVK